MGPVHLPPCLGLWCRPLCCLGILSFEASQVDSLILEFSVYQLSPLLLPENHAVCWVTAHAVASPHCWLESKRGGGSKYLQLSCSASMCLWPEWLHCGLSTRHTESSLCSKLGWLCCLSHCSLGWLWSQVDLPDASCWGHDTQPRVKQQTQLQGWVWVFRPMNV